MAENTLTNQETHTSGHAHTHQHIHRHHHHHSRRRQRRKTAIKNGALYALTVPFLLTTLLLMYAAERGIEDIKPLLWKLVPIFCFLGVLVFVGFYMVFLYREKKRHAS